MNSDLEIMEYLQMLIEHKKECDVDDCRLCGSMRSICSLVSNWLFSSPTYPGAMATKTGRSAAASRRA
jgi:hypothetical protein